MFIKTTPMPDMTKAYDVSGKMSLSPGGNRGIAAALCRPLPNRVRTWLFCAATSTAVKRPFRRSKSSAAAIPAIQCDVADIDSVKAATAEVFKFFDTVDVLVNNAGVATTKPFLSEEGLSEWHRVINTDLHGPANVVHEIAPRMVDAGKGGTIINITSVGGQRVSGSKHHHNAPYNASKAGLDIFSRYLAVVLGDHGIRVNSIAPGPIHSDLDKDLPASFIETIRK